MNAKTIVGLFTAVFLVAGAALALNLFALAASDRHVYGYGYGVQSNVPSYVNGKQCQNDPVGCSLVVW
jgi:hypothetical protein